MPSGPVGADGVIVGVLPGPQIPLASLASQGNSKAPQKRVQGVARSFDKIRIIKKIDLTVIIQLI